MNRCIAFLNCDKCNRKYKTIDKLEKYKKSRANITKVKKVNTSKVNTSSKIKRDYKRYNQEQLLKIIDKIDDKTLFYMCYSIDDRCNRVDHKCAKNIKALTF